MTETNEAAPTATDTPSPSPSTTPAPADAAALDRRDQELTALYEHDRNAYLYGNQGALAREHADLRRAQQAAKEATPQVAEQAEGDDASASAEAIDLELPNEVADDETNEEAEEGEVGEIEASSSDEAVGVDSYTPPAIEGVSWSDDALKPIIGVAARHGVSEAALSEALSAYGEAVQQQQARISELNATTLRETTKALKGELGDNFKAYREEANEAFKALPKEFREQLKTARLADGTLLLNTAGAVHLFHQLGTATLQARSGQQPRQALRRNEMLREELAELVALRDRDINAYRRPWKATGISGSDRVLQISRELAHEGPATPSAADRNAEMRELEQLRTRDPDLFRFGSWRQTGRSPAERLHRLQTGRV